VLLGLTLALAGCAPPPFRGPGPVVQGPPPQVDPARLPPFAAFPGAQRPAVGPDGKIRVAILLPLSGPQGALGQAMLNAAQLALFDAQRPNLELVPRDTRGSPEGAAEAARATLAQGASLILGPLLSAETAAVAPQARAAGVNVISFTTDRAVAGNGVFILGFLTRDQVQRVVAEAVQAGSTRFAVLAPEDAYGQQVLAEARAVIQAGNAELVQVETYPARGVEQITAAVQRLAGPGARNAAAERRAAQRAIQRGQQVTLRTRELPFDALLLADGGERLRAAAALLPYYNIDSPPVRLLGTGLWADPQVAGEPSLIGGWFAAPPEAPRQVFEARYRDTYGARPPLLAGLAYDAAALAGALAGEQGGPDFSAAAIANPDGFAGANGIFRFLADGTNQRGLAVQEVQRGSFRIVAEAPDSFEGGGF